MRAASSAISIRPMPSTLLAVPVKYLSTNALLQADGLEDLRAAVRLVGGDAHLGHHLEQPLADRLDEALAGLGASIRGHCVLHRGQRLEREVRMDRLGAVAGEHGEVVHLARRAGLDHEAGAGAQAGAHQMVVHGAGGEQRRDRQLRRRDRRGR